MLSIKDKIKEQMALDVEVKTARVIDKILNYAIGCEAREIYFEPGENVLEVNFKIDGESEKVVVLPKSVEEAVITGIKEMAGLNLPDSGATRSGKFKKECLGYKIIFSASVRQSTAGEKVIIDLKKEKFQLLGLGQLGLSGMNLAVIRKHLDKRKGLIMIVGDFNSGRTSTLYSFLNHLKQGDLNITTLEEHVALDLPEINQSRIDKASGYGPEVAGRALRHQDSDIVMIGDVNDEETAQAAMHLASAGHFVLGGVYGANIGSALSLLKDLGVPLHLFNATAKIVVAQHLLEKNCPHCLAKVKPSTGKLAIIKKRFKIAPLFEKMRTDKILTSKISNLEDLVFYKGRGCSRCSDSGVQGKIGVFEVLEMKPAVKQLIKEGHFSQVTKEINHQGRYTLVEDAFIKAVQGIVSFDEVLKIIGE